MNAQSIIVAISPNAAYTTAVIKWGWHCDQRTIPEFQTKIGEVVKFIADGKLFNKHNVLKIKGEEIYIYLGDRWEDRGDASIIKNYVSNGMLILKE